MFDAPLLLCIDMRRKSALALRLEYDCVHVVPRADCRGNETTRGKREGSKSASRRSWAAP